jgi:hypothetical protein
MAKQASPKAKKEKPKAKAKRISNCNVYVRGYGTIKEGQEIPEGVEIDSKYVA